MCFGVIFESQRWAERIFDFILCLKVSCFALEILMKVSCNIDKIYLSRRTLWLYSMLNHSFVKIFSQNRPKQTNK